MRQTRRAFLGATTAAAPGVAGCAGDGSGSGRTTTEPTTTRATTPDPTTDTTAGGRPLVDSRNHPEYGPILTDADGMTLYMFDQDTRGAGSSTCYDGCASSWPPLTVEGEATAGDSVTAPLTTFERESGERQVAAGGWPLYYFASDQAAGDAGGQGVGGVWWVLAPDGTQRRPSETTSGTDGY